MALGRLARQIERIRRSYRSSGSHRRTSRRRWGRLEQLEPRILLHHSPSHVLTGHYHAHLSIFIEGQNIDIPADIGVDSTGVIDFVHTHDPDGLLHIHPTTAGDVPTEFQTVGDFFDIWRTNAGDAGNNPDAVFNENQILDAVADADHTIRFFVNGAENDDFEDYILKDGDQIVISYEEVGDADAPVLDPISNLTLVAGQSFQLPLNGFDPNGSPITYTFASSNANVTGVLTTGNPSLQINVSGTDFEGNPFTGDLVFQLYEDLAPETVAEIVDRVNSGFYDGQTFYRILDGFVAQFGDRGISAGTNRFSDEFSTQATFTGFAQLAMANSGDDTNSTELFVTDGNLSHDMAGASDSQLPPRHLNFQHTIFGQLVDGFDILEKIITTRVTGETPNSTVRINDAEIVTDHENGVMRLFAPAGFTGTADVTITAINKTNQIDVQTFEVEVVADTQNDRPFLGPVSDLVTNEGAPVTFTLTATDLENDALTFAVRDANAAGFSNPPSNVSVSINQATGEVTITPNAGFSGTVQMRVGVRDDTARGGAALGDLSQFDTEVITLTVADVNLQPEAFGDTVTFSPGQPVTIQLTGDDGDPDKAQTFTFEIVTQPTHGTLSGFNSQTGTVVYTPNDASVTNDSFTFRVMDNGGTEDGGQDTSDPATITLSAEVQAEIPVSDASIRAARLHHGTLRIKGSRHDDVILVGLNEAGDQVEVTLNSRDVQMFDVGDVRRIKIYGRGGDDFIQIDDNVVTAAKINGGRGDDVILSGGGNDRIKAGSGNDIVMAGGGNDRVDAGRGEDLLIGGDGADRLRGRKNDDLLIAGTTAFDDNHAALEEILAEWTSSRDFDTRVMNLRDGSGSTERLNGDTFLVSEGSDATVFDDGVKDNLKGDRGHDWFFASNDDDIRRLRSGDLLDELTETI